jgi:hypothetical protein
MLENQTEMKIRLLREVLEASMWEISVLNDARWEDLPSLSVKKQQLLNKMSEFEWTPETNAGENFDLQILKGQIRDLEYQIGQRLETNLNIIRSQLEDIRKRQFSWRQAVRPYRSNKI